MYKILTFQTLSKLSAMENKDSDKSKKQDKEIDKGSKKDKKKAKQKAEQGSTQGKNIEGGTEGGAQGGPENTVTQDGQAPKPQKSKAELKAERRAIQVGNV